MNANGADPVDKVASGGPLDMMGGFLPPITGGPATAFSDAQSGTIYGGTVDIDGLTGEINFGGSGAGLNTGAASFLSLAVIGAIALVGVLWLKK